MSFNLKNLKDFASGKLSESAFLDSVNGTDTDFENDEEFLRECTAACMPTIIQMALMDETADTLDEDVKEAFIKVQDYLVGQGLMDEAATVSLSNPKVTVVRMSKEAQKKRLTTIISLKMARRDKMKAFAKYKLGMKIKKENLAQILQRYGDRASRIATKLVAKHRNGKVAAVVEQKKSEKKSHK